MNLFDLLARIKPFVQLGQSRKLPGICSANEFQTILERERSRVNRNGHKFSLLVFDVGRSDQNHIRMQCLAHVLKNRVRRTDLAGLLDNHRIGVILLYTSEAGAWRLVNDVCQSMGGEATPPECTVRTYPSEHNSGGEHREQLSFADLSPKWNTTATGGLSMSAKHTGNLNNDFASRQSPADTMRDCHEVAHSSELLFSRRLPLWKRSMDIVGALFALIVLSPVLLLVSFIIKIASRGPVIFKQERARYSGKTFSMWKFRTMGVNTNISDHRQYVLNLLKGAKGDNPDSESPMVKLDGHPQIIPLGRFIRKTCLDELPQLVNVLRGEMSLVGPRPALQYEVAEYPQWYHGRFDAVPGMTGLWQVSGKNRLTFNEMARLDIRYARQASLWLDTKILLKTPSAIISQIMDSLRANNWRLLRNAT